MDKNNSLSLLIKPVSGLCNMRCDYCFYSEVVALRSLKHGVMADDTVNAVIAKASKSGAKNYSICFQGGEPTLAGVEFFKNFCKKFCESAGDSKCNFTMQTNGLVINDEWIKLFKDYNFLVGLSLDGFENANKMRKNFNGDSVFSQVMRSANLLAKNGVAFNILAVVTQQNSGNIVEIYNFFKDNEFRYLQFIACLSNLQNVGAQDYSLSEQSYEKVYKTIFDCWYNDYVAKDYVSVRHIDNLVAMSLGLGAENCGMSGKCGGYFAVESDGSVYPCDFYSLDEYALGNVAQQSFEFNFDSPVYKKFCDEGRMPLECKNCKYAHLCHGGCRRERESDFTKMRYCNAKKNYFEYIIPRLNKIAEQTKKRLVLK